MLRNVLISAAQSGLVLFAKEFVADGLAQPRLTGSLLSAMREAASRAIGLAPFVIELRGLLVIVARDAAANVLCALVCDRDDGREFAAIVAAEILAAFIDEVRPALLPFSTAHHPHAQYGSMLGGGGALNLKDFLGFDRRIKQVVRDAVRPVLARLHGAPGIARVVLVTNAEVVQFGGASADGLSIVSDLSALTDYADLVMTNCSSAGSIGWDHITVDGRALFPRTAADGTDEAPQIPTARRRTMLWRLANDCVLVVCSDADAPVGGYSPALDEAVHVLRQMAVLLSSVVAEGG